MISLLAAGLLRIALVYFELCSLLVGWTIWYQLGYRSSSSARYLAGCLYAFASVDIYVHLGSMLAVEDYLIVGLYNESKAGSGVCHCI